MTREPFPPRAILSLAALALVFTAGILAAGPLNPPAGPVASSYKTLTEVEPRIAISALNTPGDADSLFRITQPGSYYLTGNITGAVGKHGIEIAASGVTIDLNGFDLVGVPAMGPVDGVSATATGLTNIAVVNGSVRNWGQDGINLGTFSVTVCRIEGIQASGNVRVGVYTGLLATVSKSGATGGQYGLFARGGSTVTGCSASAASLTGISSESGCTLSNCSAHDNVGVSISAGFSGTLTNCAAYNNDSFGISANSGCVVSDCSARLNGLDGIVVTSNCIVRSNTSASNGNVADGAGIRVAGNDNRIEGNNCTASDRGLDVDGSGNIIIRNSCSGNTTWNWDIAAGNVALIVNAGTNPGGYAGNAGGVAPGSTDPNANFSY